jgi:GT2 family glycosyltransferase
LACGGDDALVRLEAFELVGGFRAQLIAGEEPELCLPLREIGWKIWRLDAEMTEHDASITRFKQWWIRTVRSGYGFADASWLHQNSPLGIWRREILRAFLLGGLLPVSIVLGALLHRAALLGASAYFVQICRVALKDRPTSHRPWLPALLLTLAKFAEFQGILKFVWRRRQQGAAALIEYK